MKKSMQKSLVFLFLGLLLISLLVGFVSAASESELCKAFSWSTTSSFCVRAAIWEQGMSIDSTNVNFIGAMTKYLILLLILILIYSALAFANFPENAGLRMTLAVIGGILSTFLITTKELITGLISYSALGVTLFTFFPILVLGFFTLVVATKANPIGIFLQRIMWLIYSVYLFIKTGVLAYAMSLQDPAESAIVKFFVGNDISQTANGISPDVTMLIVLLVVSIAVFIIMVLGDKPIVAWLAKEKRDSEREAQKAMLERSHAYDKDRADMIQKEK